MDLVNFVAKVIAKEVDVKVVGSAQFRETECFEADESLKQARLVLCENDIEKVLVGYMCAFKNIRVRSNTFHASESEVILNTTKDTTMAKLEDHALVMLVKTLEENDLFSSSTSVKVPLTTPSRNLISTKNVTTVRKELS